MKTIYLILTNNHMRIWIFLILFSQSAVAQIPDDFKQISTIAAMEQAAHIRLNSREQATAASANVDIHYYRCE